MELDLHGLLKDEPELWDLFTLKKCYSGDNGIPEDPFCPSVSRFLSQNGVKFEYPENKQFAVCLTHDIDDIYPPLSNMLLSMAHNVKNVDLSGLSRDVSWKFKGIKSSPFLNFKEIMALEDRFDARSSFYFMATDRDIKRFRYDIEDVESEMGQIADTGREIGLHGGYYAYNDLDAMIKEKSAVEKTLGKAICGYRNHYLRFSYPETWELLELAGFRYDTTIGYSNGVGFKNGMCHPFKPYNITADKKMGILEIPMAVMDCALFEHTRSFREAWDVTKRLIDETEHYNGVITMLWHNDAFSSAYKRDWMKMYVKLMDYAHGKNAWITSGENVYKWWDR